MDFERCQPDSFLEKSKSTVDVADLLFVDSNLIETNTGGGITINNAKNPCPNVNKVCCKPKEIEDKPDCPSEDCQDNGGTGDPVIGDCVKCIFKKPGEICDCNTDKTVPPDTYTECGKRNPFGLKM